MFYHLLANVCHIINSKGEVLKFFVSQLKNTREEMRGRYNNINIKCYNFIDKQKHMDTPTLSDITDNHKKMTEDFQNNVRETFFSYSVEFWTQKKNLYTRTKGFSFTNKLINHHNF